MLMGGISFTTPDKLAKKKNFTPEENHIYQLHESYEDAIADIPELQHSGKTVSILAEDASSLSIGAPILHKNIKIGIIEDFSLTEDQQSVLVKCLIYDEYKNLVNNQTRFYNTSGLQLSGGLNGVRFQTGSLQSIIAGGIGCFNTPKNIVKKQPGDPYPLYNDLQEALHADEIELTVTFQETKGLKEGSTVRYKGIEVGKVQHLSFSKDLQTIVAKVSVHESVRELLRENTMFWVAEAEINLNGVKNVETIVFGSFLSFLPGDGAPKRTFAALAEPPRNKIANMNGLGIVLEAKHLGSLSPGSPVYYRQVHIGQVTGYELSPTFQKVYIFISIKDRYRAIIRSNTRFWNVSGATIEGGLFSGVKVSTESFEAIMKGGIALATPDDEKVGAAASAGDHFPLHDKAEKKWLDWNPDIVLLELEESNKVLLQGNTDK
jgi:paraquat-inducible protein B